MVTPAGRWRLYVSCATPGTKHWWVELLEADSPEGLADAPSVTVLPGDASTAVKDPVVQSHGGEWHLWASVHPLDDPEATDRMTTEYATSPDGVAWTWRGTALGPVPGRWDARGVRISSVVDLGDRVVALYDGRATAAENWEERTGYAEGTGAFGHFRAPGDGPVASAPDRPTARAPACATSTWSPCPAARTGCTTRSRGPTGRTSCAPSSSARWGAA